MLLKIFKANPMLLLVSGIAFCTMLWVAAFLHPGETTHPYSYLTLLGPLFDKIHELPIIKGILGLALLLLIAGVWNRIVNKHSLLKQSTYFPFFFMLILLSCRASLIGFYPALVSSLFLVLFLDKLISSYKKENALSDIFDSGLFIGIATLFYIPSMLFIIVLWVGLFTIRTINSREWLCSVIGFLIPFLFLYVYTLVFFHGYRWYDKITNEFEYHSVHFSFSWEQITIMIIMSLAALGSLWLFLNKVGENVLKTQKFWSLMVWFMFISIASVLICPVKDSRAFSILAIPGSFVLSVYFLRTRSKVIPELLFISMLAGVIISMFF